MLVPLAKFERLTVMVEVEYALDSNNFAPEIDSITIKPEITKITKWNLFKAIFMIIDSKALFVVIL